MSRNCVRRETGKEYEVKVLYGEGHANHTGPEPCVAAREGGGEASAGVRAGWVLSRESLINPECRRRAIVGRQHGSSQDRVDDLTRRVVDPTMYVNSLRGNREISCLSGGEVAPSGRIGKARSRSR